MLTLPPKDDAILVLSIHPVHAGRIFDGSKLFELRKALPKQPFSRVFLYATGGGGIVGCFDAGDLIVASVDELWTIVGERATSRERFFQYFVKSSFGYAIPVHNPVRFREAICPPSLKRLVPKFTAPMSYLLVRRGTLLYKTLEQKRREQSQSPLVKLLALRRCDRPLFLKLVTAEIAPRYDDITEHFARSILKTHQIGFDPNGIFTLRKRIFTITDLGGRLAGFTTLTYKIGGCAKTGPTVILPRFRKRGFGLATRRELMKIALTEKIRKLYCTCPDNDPAVLSYLIRSGFRVEAHLKQHYTSAHGEFVLGRFVIGRSKPLHMRIPRLNETAEFLESAPKKSLAAFFRRMFEKTWFPVTGSLCKAIASTDGHLKAPYEEKPLRVFCFGNQQKCVAAILVVPKRGGAVKALLFSSTSHPSSLRSMIQTVERQLHSLGKRKLYFVHPSDDLTIIDLLKSCSYVVEGLLEEPYRKGQDAILLAKMLP